jgi:hypothetical protein
VSFLASLFLALSLISADSTTPAETACTARWEPEADAWHECFCALETWRCEAQGWCSWDPGHEPDITTIGLPTTTREGCQ